MHIALVSTFYYPRLHGGTEHSLQLHAEALVRRGFRVSVLSLHEGGKPEHFEHNGVSVHTLPAPNLARCLARPQRASAAARAVWHLVDVYNPVAGRLLERELRRLKPDLVHTANLPGWSCAAWAAVRRCGIPHVQMLHDFQLTCPAATRFRDGRNCTSTCAKCAALSWARLRASQRVRHVVANSEYTREVHRSLGFFARAETFDVIHGCVAAVPTPPQDVGRAPDSPLRLGYIGRLHPTKGVELLVDAFRATGRRDLVLRIAGTGADGYPERLRSRAGGGRVELLGHVAPSEFLSSIDVLVVPSLWNEPMGRVVIEAARAGVPVIAAKRGGIPELVLERRTGWLFEPDDPDELTERLRDLTPGVTLAMRDACLDWGAEFSPERISAKWEALYTRVAAARTPGTFHGLLPAGTPVTTPTPTWTPSPTVRRPPG